MPGCFGGWAGIPVGLSPSRRNGPAPEEAQPHRGEGLSAFTRAGAERRCDGIDFSAPAHVGRRNASRHMSTDLRDSRLACSRPDALFVVALVIQLVVDPGANPTSSGPALIPGSWSGSVPDRMPIGSRSRARLRARSRLRSPVLRIISCRHSALQHVGRAQRSIDVHVLVFVVLPVLLHIAVHCVQRIGRRAGADVVPVTENEAAPDLHA